MYCQLSLTWPDPTGCQRSDHASSTVNLAWFIQKEINNRLLSFVSMEFQCILNLSALASAAVLLSVNGRVRGWLVLQADPFSAIGFVKPKGSGLRD